ncbi:MAG: VOC family protein [Caldisericia bacterium]|nr:VOC family protein [Caldisericia bacterium]
MSEPKKANLKFLYLLANDLKALRHFYSDLLNMQENSYYEDEQFGWLSYHADGIEMDWFRTEKPLPVIEEWAMQPGYPGGTKEVISWSIEIDEGVFPDLIEKIKLEKIPVFQEKPEFRQDSYWGFSVKDPMGNTVELYYVPKK